MRRSRSVDARLRRRRSILEGATITLFGGSPARWAGPPVFGGARADPPASGEAGPPRRLDHRTATDRIGEALDDRTGCHASGGSEHAQSRRVRGRPGGARAPGRSSSWALGRGGAVPAGVARSQPAGGRQEGAGLAGLPSSVRGLHAGHPPGGGRCQPGRHGGDRHHRRTGRAHGLQRGDRPAPGVQGRGERQGSLTDDEDDRQGASRRPGGRGRRRGAGPR